MADTTITLLTGATAALPTHEYIVNEAGADKKVTGAQLAVMAQGVTVDTYAAGMSTNLTAGTRQTATLGGAVTSWVTTNKAAGLPSIVVFIKALVDGTFTRATTAYDLYTGASVGSGVTRYSVVPNNICTTSENVAALSPSASTVVHNAGTSPVSTQFDALVDTTTSAQHYATVTSSATVGAPFTVSAFVRAGSNNFVYINQAGALICYYNLSTGAVATNGSGGTCNIYSVPGFPGVYRITYSVASATYVTFRIGTCVADATATYVGSGVGSSLIIGIQAEQSATATAYNPTGTLFPGCGMVVEQATTNLLTANQSDVETGTTGFTPQGSATLTRDTGAGNFWRGTAGLKCVTGNAATGEGLQFASVAVTGGQTYTFSTRLKGSGTVELFLYDGFTSTHSTVNTLSSTFTEFTYTKTLNASSTTLVAYIITDVQQGITFYCDGMQIELGAYATSWTLGGSTRNAETFSVPGANVAAAAGAIVIEAYVSGDKAAATSVGTYVLFDAIGTAGNRIMLYVTPGTPSVYTLYTKNGASAALTATWASALATGFHKFGIRWGAGNAYLDVDGVQVATLAGTLPTDITSAGYVGCNNAGAAQWDDIVRSFATFLTDIGAPALAAYTNPHDPSVPARLNAAASYFIDFSVGGGNQAPARNIVLNSAWKVVGPAVRPTNLPSGKTARMALECFATTEADIVCHYNAEAA